MILGTIKFFDTNRGFGFITGDDGADIFFHAKQLRDRMDEGRIMPGMAVEFTASASPDGRPRATDVELLG